MASDDKIIEDAVQQSMLELEQRAPIQMHRLKLDKEKYQKVLRSAREAATEQVKMAKEFVGEPSDILERLKKHLPQKRIKMLQAGLSIPTYRMDIVKSADGHHTVSFKRGDEVFLESRNLLIMEDVDWASIMQYASIVLEAVILVLSAIGILLSPSSEIIEEATEEAAEALKNSSQFEKAVQAFVDAWHAAGDSASQKAKALFFLVKDTYAAGLLWTIIKSLCSSMRWYEWLETAAKVIAMLLAAFATGGLALIGKIALIVLSAVDFARKLVNMSQLKEMKSSMRFSQVATHFREAVENLEALSRSRVNFR